MNVLILNWRDPKNPKGGDAEILTHEIVKHWVKNGSRFRYYQKIKDVIDEINI